MNWKNHKPKQPSGGKTMRIEDFTKLSPTPIPKVLIGGLAIILGILAYGLFLLHHDREAFLIWIREDGLAEWLTFIELLIMSVYSFMSSYLFSHSKNEEAARRVWLFFGFLFLFGAMEEISWGQRILGIESPEWFLKHNRQFETNVHNLVIYGVNLNKLVFGRILGIMVLIYMLATPILYRLNRSFKNFINRWAIPIPQNYQILLFIIINIILGYHLGLIKKVSELRELSNCFFFLLALMHPYNDQVFPIKGLSFLKRTILMKEGKS
jgi:hypothetical protein